MKTETAKHTPGPWLFKAISPDIAHKSIVGPLNETGTSRNILAEVHMIHPNHDADGCLMAAAPELYDYVSEKAGQGDPKAMAILELINAGR